MIVYRLDPILFISIFLFVCFFFSSRRRHTRLSGDWSSDVCSSDLLLKGQSRAVFPSSRVSAASPRARTLNSGRLAQPCFWHFGGQRALDHLLGWEREGSTNSTLET